MGMGMAHLLVKAARRGKTSSTDFEADKRTERTGDGGV